jgi:hypothetical protein
MIFIRACPPRRIGLYAPSPRVMLSSFKVVNCIDDKCAVGFPLPSLTHPIVQSVFTDVKDHFRTGNFVTPTEEESV